MMYRSIALLAASVLSAVIANKEKSGLSSRSYPAPRSCGFTDAFSLATADSWTHVKIAGGLKDPRGITVDTEGNLLVIESGKGLTAFTFGHDGCIASSKVLIDNADLNHGITLTPDGKQLVVSSETTAWRYLYDAATQVLSNEEVVIKNMQLGGHSTRTVVIPPQTPNLLLASVGSLTNLDWESLDKNVGRSLVKVFDLGDLPAGGFDYRSQGWFLGYGLRNEVAVVVDSNNMVWGIENSADKFTRTVGDKVYDIHNGNPAEELNYLGDPTVSNENWYGYPTCYSVWNGDVFPDGNFSPGSQFLPAPNATWTDALCAERAVPPRLVLEAHTAPIDGKFNADSSAMYATLHGSWNSDSPTGYKVVEIPFKQNKDGGHEPVAAQNSGNGYNDILWDTGKDCNAATCLRPSGLDWDNDFSRIFFASDGSEGELFMLYKETGELSGPNSDEL